MGFTLDDRGKPIYNDESDPQPDLQGSADWADRVGGLLKGPRSDRTSLSPGQTSLGWLFVETDTGLIYRRVASGWRCVTTGLFSLSVLSNQSVVLPTAMTTVSGLQIDDAPTGIPCLLSVSVTAENGTSGGNRFVDVRAFNGVTAIDVLQRFSLPYPSTAGHRFTQVFDLLLTPSDAQITLQLGCDQASSVVLRGASLKLFVRP